ncbi:MAG: RNA-binding protein [Desulfotalea sp.]|nr:MAG: RNA-binding protein [Desulfotalea sp.]
MNTILVKTLPIRLGQFLKFADMVQDGIEAKIHIREGKVKVNEEVETRRGKKLQHNDVVRLFDMEAQVVLDQ